jgi:hypothetical protein
MRRLALIFIAVTVSAAGLDPRPKVEDYPKLIKTGQLKIGAEYQGRGLSAKSQSWWVGDYLVVEVGLYREPGAVVEVHATDFRLRINGEKTARNAEIPSLVAAASRNTGLNMRRGIEAGGGVGDSQVIFGRPRTEARFPGDPSGGRGPTAPRAPSQDDNAEPPMETSAAVMELAMPEGEVREPVSGYLYFPYAGKAKKIKSLELIITTKAGELRVSLF